MKDLENKVIYQIYPKSFMDSNGDGIGDLQGIISKLDYLKNLGVDYIWLSPCCKSPQKDNGYDISDYEMIDPIFGSNEDYLEMIKEANKRGIKVMMDLVLNHTSSEHEWFKKAKQKDPKYFDYYVWRDEPNELQSFFGGSAWEYCEEVGKYYLHCFAKEQPDLNWDNPNVRADLYKMINKWIDLGVEGFRLDVIDMIGKDVDNMITAKGPKFYEYLKDLNNHTFKDKLLTVGECWGSSIEDTYKMCNKDGLTQAFNFRDISIDYDGNKWNEQGLHLQLLVDLFDEWQNEFTGINTLVIENHDLPRLISRWLNDDCYRVESAKLLATVFGILKGNMYIYQGQEIGMTNAYLTNIDNYLDIESINFYNEKIEKGVDSRYALESLIRTSRDNARINMRWNEEQYQGFSTVKPWLTSENIDLKINVDDDLKSDRSIYRYYQKLLQFRKDHYDLIDTKAKFTQIDNNLLVIEKEKIKLVANFTDKKHYYSDNYKNIIMSNYDNSSDIILPYEVRVYYK